MSPADHSGPDLEAMAKWLAAMESGSLHPPSDVHDRDAWNQFWIKQLEVGAFEQGFSDMMSSDDTLVPLLRRRHATSILCAGIGMSSEALALALHGFHVVALDLSDVPGQIVPGALTNATHRLGSALNLTLVDGRITFPTIEALDPDLAPSIHKSPGHPPHGGGSLTYVTGDLTDAQVCPGPFDVVIERRTVQLFPKNEQSTAMQALAGRLASPGFLISHQHAGGWRPGESRGHFAADWADASEFTNEHKSTSVDTERRLLRLYVSTG